jgi:sugar lactone lactonase YvrE
MKTVQMASSGMRAGVVFSALALSGLFANAASPDALADDKPAGAPLTAESGAAEKPIEERSEPAPLPGWESQFVAPATQLATGLRFAEGPLVLRDASGTHAALLVCDLGGSSLHTVAPLPPAEPPLDKPLPSIKWLDQSQAAAGAALDAQGHLLLARFAGDIARSDAPLDWSEGAAPPVMRPIVESAQPIATGEQASESVKLGRCNDLVVLPWGDVLFTDFGSRDKAKPSKGLFVAKVTSEDAGDALAASATGFVAQCIDSDYKAANGLAFDAVRGVLYVADYGAAQVIAYDLSDADRTPSNRRVFANFADVRQSHKLQGMVDGMKVDDATGNLLTTGPGGVWVLSSAGQRLALLPLEGASNLAIGGGVTAEGKVGVRDVFITAGTGVWRAQLKALADVDPASQTR